MVRGHGTISERFVAASFLPPLHAIFRPALPVKRHVCARFPFVSMSGYGQSPPFARKT